VLCSYVNVRKLQPSFPAAAPDACGVRRLEFDDVFLVDFFSDSSVTAGWRVLLQLLAEYETVVEAVARYAAALQADRAREAADDDALPPQTWEELATTMTAGEMRKLVASARDGRIGSSNLATQALANDAVDAADHSDMLKTLPTTARLMRVPPSSDEEAGWLRPLAFDLQQHRCANSHECDIWGK